MRRDERAGAYRATQGRLQLHLAFLRLQAQHRALVGADVERAGCRVEGEWGKDASHASAPQRVAVAQAHRVHLSVGVRLGGDKQPVLIQQRAGAYRPVDTDFPKHSAARAIEQHHVAVPRPHGDDGFAQRWAAAHAAPHGRVPEGAGGGIEAFLCGGVVALVTKVDGPA